MKTVHSIVLVVVAALTAFSCTNESGSRRALEGQGFTDVEFDGYALYGCGDDDTFHTAFHAKNARGVSVSGLVCCGMLKSCTVRF